MLTDFHSHILPGIDDGSASVEESIAMLKQEAAQGVKRVVATPHFYPHRESPEGFLERRHAAEQILRAEMAKHSDLPELVIGAEVYYFRGISDYDHLKRLTTGKKGCILIEMPMMDWSESMLRELGQIRDGQGLMPAVAHLDRYIRPLHTCGIPESLEQLGVYVQANADSFLRHPMKALMLRLLKADRIHLLGSDCHNLRDRKPNLAEAVQIIERRLGRDVLERIREYEAVLL